MRHAELARPQEELDRLCEAEGLSLSEETLLMKYFPYAINPATISRLDFLVRNLVEGESLDAGCGTGWVSCYLMEYHKRNLVQVDLSREALREAKVLFHSLNSTSCFLVKSDISELPFRDECFDNIVCFSVLEHVPSVKSVLEEFYRVSNVEGRLIVALPNKYGSYSLINDRFIPLILSIIGKKRDKNIRSYHETLQVFDWWKKEISSHGFQFRSHINIEFLQSLFVKVANILRIQRKSLWLLNLLDAKLATHLPRFFASDWIMVFEKAR